jgi:DNA-binding transcriptional regulator YiaG
MAHQESVTPAQIRAARRDAGHTQAQAAALMDSHVATWKSWEGGLRTMQPLDFKLYKHLAGLEPIPFVAIKR